MKYCPTCKKIMSDSFSFCPYCGGSLEDYDEYQKRIALEEKLRKEKEEATAIRAKKEIRRHDMENALDRYLGRALAYPLYAGKKDEEVERIYDIAIAHINHNPKNVSLLLEKDMESIIDRLNTLHLYIQKILDASKESDTAKMNAKILRTAIDKLVNALLYGGEYYSLDYPAEYSRYPSTIFEVHDYQVQGGLKQKIEDINNSKDDFGLLYLEANKEVRDLDELLSGEMILIRDGLNYYGSSYYYEMIRRLSDDNLRRFDGHYLGYDKRDLREK